MHIHILQDNIFTDQNLVTYIVNAFSLPLNTSAANLCMYEYTPNTTLESGIVVALAAVPTNGNSDQFCISFQGTEPNLVTVTVKKQFSDISFMNFPPRILSDLGLNLGLPPPFFLYSRWIIRIDYVFANKDANTPTE